MAMSRQVGRGLERAGRGDPGASVPLLIGAVVVFTAIGLAASYAPQLLTSLLVVGGVVGLAVVAARGGRVWGWRGGSRPATGEAGLAPSHTEGELVQWVAGLLGSFRYQLQRLEPAKRPAGPGIELTGLDPDGRLIVVRCLSNAPGDRVGFLVMLRLMAAVIQERAEGGILVTTTSFTPAAITLAGFSPASIALYDGSALARPEWTGTAA